MGNYYTGNLQFYLKKDICPEDLKDLKKLDERVLDQTLYSERIQRSRWFEHKRWDYPIYDLYKLYVYDENGPCKTYAYDDYGNRKYLLCLMEEEVDEEGLLFVGYELDVQICMKLYRDDGNDLGEAIVGYLRPMCDSSIFDKERGSIGHIHDEDGTYNKEFYLDEKVFQEKKKKRSFLCENCAFDSEFFLCEDWEKCFRAYKLGKAKE